MSDNASNSRADQGSKDMIDIDLKLDLYKQLLM